MYLGETVLAVGAATSFWTESKDLFALIVSFLALAVSIVTSRQNLAATRVIANEAADHNRRLRMTPHINACMSSWSIPKRRPVDGAYFRQRGREDSRARRRRLGRDRITPRALLTLAGYVYRKQVDEEAVLDAWHHPLANIAEPVREFMAHRQVQDAAAAWG